MQPDRRLVEDAGDVGERRSEVADHFGPLRLAARKAFRTGGQAEVAEPDLDEQIEDLPQCDQQRRDRLVEARIHCARSVICIAQASAMLIPWIFASRAVSLSRCRTPDRR